MVKHTQIVRWEQLTNCLNEFDHFVGLALEELKPVPMHNLFIILFHQNSKPTPKERVRTRRIFEVETHSSTVAPKKNRNICPNSFYEKSGNISQNSLERTCDEVYF